MIFKNVLTILTFLAVFSGCKKAHENVYLETFEKPMTIRPDGSTKVILNRFSKAITDNSDADHITLTAGEAYMNINRGLFEKPYNIEFSGYKLQCKNCEFDINTYNYYDVGYYDNQIAYNSKARLNVIRDSVTVIQSGVKKVFRQGQMCMITRLSATWEWWASPEKITWVSGYYNFDYISIRDFSKLMKNVLNITVTSNINDDALYKVHLSLDSPFDKQVSAFEDSTGYHFAYYETTRHLVIDN